MERGLTFGGANAFLHLHLAEAYQRTHGGRAPATQCNHFRRPTRNYLPEYRKEAVGESAQTVRSLEHSEQYRTETQSIPPLGAR